MAANVRILPSLSALLLLLLGAVPLPARARHDCFAVVVGRKCSAGGSLLVAHNEDDGPPAVVYHWRLEGRPGRSGEKVELAGGGSVPAPGRRLGILWTQMVPGYPYSDCYLNEKGVVLCSNACRSREDRPALVAGGIGFMLRRLVALQAGTARAGVDLATGLVDRFGYRARGRTLVIADPREAWLLCLVGGKHYAAVRVPDDRACALANTFPIHAVDFADRENWRTSPGLKEYAVERGWYDEERDGPFEFARVFADPVNRKNPLNVHRQWSALTLLTGQEIEEHWRLPLFVAPARPVTAAHLMALLRQRDRGFGRHSICRASTRLAHVYQLRPQLPPAIGALAWTAPARPDRSCFLPCYLGSRRVPAGFNRGRPETGLEATRAGREWEPRHPPGTAPFLALARRERAGGTPTPASLERGWLALQAEVEATALRLHRRDPELARDWLTAYTLGQTERARRFCRELLEEEGAAEPAGRER